MCKNANKHHLSLKEAHNLKLCNVSNKYTSEKGILVYRAGDYQKRVAEHCSSKTKCFVSISCFQLPLNLIVDRCVHSRILLLDLSEPISGEPNVGPPEQEPCKILRIANDISLHSMNPNEKMNIISGYVAPGSLD